MFLSPPSADPIVRGMNDLFDGSGQAGGGSGDYTAQAVEVLEGLEPVRRRPGMYIGGTDERALHHLAAEVLDNAMDEAVEGHASWIDVSLAADGSLTVRDNGRGIPVEEHPKYPGRSTLELILTTLHSGSKFSNKIYHTAGGLHGVGLSVVNALSERLEIEVARDRQLWAQDYRRGAPKGPLRLIGPVQNRRGTTVTFHPDAKVFSGIAFRADRLYRMARSKAYLFRGVEIRWSCAPELLKAGGTTPEKAVLHFPGGLGDFLEASLEGRPTISPAPFSGTVSDSGPNGGGKVEWAITWPQDEDGFVHSYCNTVPTPQGGSHEAGLRAGLLRSLKGFAEMTGQKRAAAINADDLMGGAAVLLSVFLPNVLFEGQTKERLSSPEAGRLVEGVIKDHFDHWLSGDPTAATAMLDRIVDRCEERTRRRQARDLARKTATRKIRLPGKLADCSRTGLDGTEIFLVEGDSAGGSAKAARDRETQAVLPMRGKILNVASASADKLAGNQEIADLALALGCGTRSHYAEDRLRYDRVVIMTDADVDGAHIAALLMTFFFREMRGLIADGHLYLAQPPLYRLQRGGTIAYARDDAHKDELMRTTFAAKTGAKGKVEISRFKGLGEMSSVQLRETTMAPGKRTLWRVELPDDEALETDKLVHRLMGRKPELRLAFIQENARLAGELDV